MNNQTPSPDIGTVRNSDLEIEYKRLHQSIHVLDCFSLSDLIAVELIGRELERRGIRAVESVDFVEA